MTFVIFKTIGSFEKVKQPIEDQRKFFETFRKVIWILKCSDKIIIVYDFTDQDDQSLWGYTTLRLYIKRSSSRYQFKVGIPLSVRVQ